MKYAWHTVRAGYSIYVIYHYQSKHWFSKNKNNKVTPCVYLMLRELMWGFQDTLETSPSPKNQRAPGAPWLSQWWRATPSTAQLSSIEKCKKHTGGARLARMSLQRLHVCSSMAHVVQSSRETVKKAGILPASLRASGGSIIPSCPHTRKAGPKKEGNGDNHWGRGITLAVGHGCRGAKMTEQGLLSLQPGLNAQLLSHV